MNILVTGGAGFIGSHLCEELVKNDDNQVFCIDNFNTTYSPAIKRKNIEKLIGQDKFTLFENDITQAQDMSSIFANYSFDLVIHLAAMAGVRPSIEDPILYAKVNLIGTVHLLEECKKHNIKDFILASSSSIYGENKKIPFEETDFVDMPISPYAASKKAAELICYTYHNNYKMNTVALRFFTVYGPRQRPDLAIHKFADIIKNEGHIPMFGDGTTKRDYTYIDDIIDGMVKTISFIKKLKKPRYEIFNIGESYTVELKYLIALIEKAMKKKTTIKKLPMQQGDVPLTYANIDKAKEVLQYDPKTTIEIGIPKFIKWFLEQRD